MTEPRIADHPIDAHILERWSPRSFDASELTEAELNTLFEAARWAPSAYNYQPWRFAWALRGDAYWDDYVSALMPFNASWASKASALLFILSDRMIVPPGKSEPQPAGTASFDAGAAWGLMALQATKLGLSTHAMAGFDPVRAAQVTHAGDRYKVEVAVAIGRRGDVSALPEALQSREGPSGRLPVKEISFNGRRA
ncbi:MAG: nitroreductase family protein [Sphingomonadales bacterium]|nr:nitroreductase family protein [Sphingomonadales bacterium]MDE2170103.1 nitroreductase family protein [Sphingomonadales bacterium]